MLGANVAYTYSKGPVGTNKGVQQVAAALREVGESKRFMGLARRLGTSSMGASHFEAFAPAASDDPFSVGPAPDYQVGFRSGLSVTNSMNMTLTQGYQVLFKVFDRGGQREVVAQVTGSGFRGETEKLVKHAFALL